MKIALVHESLPDTARPDERDVFDQLRAFEAALRARGHACTRVAVGLDLERARCELLALGPDAAVNLVESLGGSGRLAHLAPALLEALGLPCTGSPSGALLETTDKLLAKRRLAAAGLPTPAWLTQDDDPLPPEPPGSEPLFIIKPIWEDASVGIADAALVRGAAEARARLEVAACPSFAERFVCGREFNLSLLAKRGGIELLPPAEISFEGWPQGKPRIVSYAAKWHEDSFEFGHTRRRFDFAGEDAPLLSRLGELALASWQLFGLRGYARIDFRVDARGEPWILELNANPCLSPDAGFAAAAERAGLGPAEVAERILEAALPAPRDAAG